MSHAKSGLPDTLMVAGSWRGTSTVKDWLTSIGAMVQPSHAPWGRASPTLALASSVPAGAMKV